ncbi:MAG: hypothetical protein K0S30_603 [Clostridia bacterium]|jgi:hypothetical protein|nr:hypothetical protein [Clostridia bacterium]
MTVANSTDHGLLLYYLRNTLFKQKTWLCWACLLINEVWKMKYEKINPLCSNYLVIVYRYKYILATEQK